MEVTATWPLPLDYLTTSTCFPSPRGSITCWRCDLHTDHGHLLATGAAPSQEEAEALAALSYVMAQGVSPLALLVTFHAQAVLTDDPRVAP